MSSAPFVFTDDHGYTFPKVLGIIRASGQPAVYVPRHLWGVLGEQRDPGQVLVIMTGAQLAELEGESRALTPELLAIQRDYGADVFLKS